MSDDSNERHIEKLKAAIIEVFELLREIPSDEYIAAKKKELCQAQELKL